MFTKALAALTKPRELPYKFWAPNNAAVDSVSTREMPLNGVISRHISMCVFKEHVQDRTHCKRINSRARVEVKPKDATNTHAPISVIVRAELYAHETITEAYFRGGLN